MVCFVIPGPLGSDTRPSTFAPCSGRPAMLIMDGDVTSPIPSRIEDRLQPLDESRLPPRLPAVPPLKLGTPVDGKRKLSPGEIGLCERLFKGCIDYSSVWVHRKEFLPFGLQPDDCAMTPNGELYFNPDEFSEDFSGEGARKIWWFMHEMVHVWQHQLGYWVMLRGAVRIGLSYEYELKRGRKLCDYNMEAQGNLLADYFALRYLRRPDIMVQSSEGGKLALFEEVLSDFIKDPSNPAHLP